MNRNASLTDLYCTDFSTNNSDKILYNEPFSFCKPKPHGSIESGNNIEKSPNEIK
jgi:hypothetical protein